LKDKQTAQKIIRKSPTYDELYVEGIMNNVDMEFFEKESILGDDIITPSN